MDDEGADSWKLRMTEVLGVTRLLGFGVVVQRTWNFVVAREAVNDEGAGLRRG